MRLHAAHVGAFAALSHDRNPLHLDPIYARRTPFGRTVVHGVAGVLAALGAWAGGRRIALESIAARFHRPLFIEEDYQLNVEEGTTLRLELARAGETHVAIELVRRPGVASADAGLPPGGDYAPDLRAETLAPFGLAPDQLPAHQLALLAWSSYTVGMEFPGRDALFAALEVHFAPAAPGEPFRLRNVEKRFDERFGRATIVGAATGAASFALTAFRRPPPVDGDLDSVAAAVGAARSFAGQTVLVTGSSRGFGAALARAFALSGARVALSARSDSPELQRVAEDVAACGAPPRMLLGDVADPTVCASLGELDVLVNNAIPAIPTAAFVDVPVADFLGFVSRAVTLAAAPCHALLPRLRLVVNVSSVYAREPEPRLAHYVAAKQALEGLTRTLALEHPDTRFVIARPPRMLTDQTNTLVKTGRLASAGTVAAALLARLADLPADRNLHEIDL